MCNNTGMSKMPLEPDSPDGDEDYSSEDWHTDGGSHLELMIDRTIWPADEIDAASDSLRAATDVTCKLFDLPPMTVGGLLCDDGRIAGLNGQFRGKDKPTNVLSFPSGETEPDGEGRLAAGEIAIGSGDRGRAARRKVAQSSPCPSVGAACHLMGRIPTTTPRLKRWSRRDRCSGKLGIAALCRCRPLPDAAEAG